MRKLKTVLVILFSLMMSLCLFACVPEEQKDPDKDPETPSETEGKVTSVRFQSDTATVTLTDAEVAAAADDAARAALVQEAAGDLNVQVTVSGESRVQVVKGDVLTYDFSKVDWDAVGNYLASAKLMSTDKFDCGEEGVALTNSLNIRIDHAFGEPDETGTASCQCGAAKTVFELGEGEYESVIVGSKGNFHGGTANDTSKGDLELLTPFGTVDQGDYKTVVNTMTAGTIRKGMTVTLYGTAQNYSLPDASVWYYPNIGIALRDFDASTSLFKSSPNYQGGMSVIVRADGWVLMDGIGDNGVSRYGTRMLAGLVGGGDNTYNYSSNGSNTNLPAAWGDFDPLNPPADTSTWGDWAASSVGTALSTGTFTDAQEISLSYTFRNDNIIELVYTVYNGSDGAAGDTLTARIKIPDEYADASFDTIVHADYTEMRFDRMEVVEQQKLEEVVFTGLGDDAIKNYVAGQAFNLEDLEGNVKVKYANDDRQVDPESFSLQVKRGEEWVTLGETDRLLVTDKDFRIMVKSGSVTAYDEMSLGDDDFISSITENSVTEVYGSGESAALGNVGFGSDNGSPAKVVITPVGRAVAAPSDAGKGTGYIVLRVYGTDLGTPATSGIAEILEGANKDYFDVKVTTGGDVTTATITGAQDTEIVIDVSKVTAPIYSVQITDIAVEGYTGELTAIPANTGATVTVVYTVDSETYASAKVGVSTSNAMLVATDALEKSGEFRGGVAYTSNKVEEANGVTTLTLTLSYGPMEIGGDAYALVNFRTTENNLTYIYYGEPVAAEGSPVVEVGGNKGYFTVDGGKLCFVVVKATENIVETDLTIGDMIVNVNAGGKDLKFTEIGAKYENGLVVYNDEDVAAAGTINATFTFNGTLDSDNAYDVDNSFVIVQSIDIAKLGITDTADFYFEYGVTQDEMNVVHVTKDGIVPVTIDSALETVVAGGDCFTTSIQAKPLKDADGNIVFYGGLVIVPAEHKWASEDGIIFTCSACGAVTKSNATQWTLGAEMFEGVTEAGLTVTMNTSNVTGDWGAVALVSGQHNAIITLPNLDPFNIETEGLTDAEKAIAATLTGTNFFPGAEDLFNGGVWNSFVNTTATPSNYATIVVEPGEDGGISYYLNGVLVVKYAYGRVNNTGGDKTGTAGDYVELFLMLVERTGLIVAKGGITAADAVVYPEALDATQIATLYANNSEEGYYPVHEHSYVTDKNADNYDKCACGQMNPDHTAESDRHVAAADDPETADWLESNFCKVCGIAMPGHTHVAYDKDDPATSRNEMYYCKYCEELLEHEHDWVNGACSLCGLACAHESVVKVGDTCTVCGGTLTADQTVSVTAGTFNWGDKLGTKNVVIAKGQTTTITLQYSDYEASEWACALFALKDFANTTAPYTFRYIDGAYVGKGDAWNAPQDGQTVTVGGDMAHSTTSWGARPTERVKATFEYKDDGSLTITVQEFAAADAELATALATRTYTVTGLTSDLYLIGFGYEVAAFEGAATVTGPAFVYPAAE